MCVGPCMCIVMCVRACVFLIVLELKFIMFSLLYAKIVKEEIFSIALCKM